MSDFTVRVELHGADHEQYDALHEAMEKRGFLRTIEGDDGVVYHLPTAEYRYHSATETVKNVCDKVFLIAAAIKALPAPFIIVSQAAPERVAFRALKPVKP